MFKSLYIPAGCFCEAHEGLLTEDVLIKVTLNFIYCLFFILWCHGDLNLLFLGYRGKKRCWWASVWKTRANQCNNVRNRDRKNMKRPFLQKQQFSMIDWECTLCSLAAGCVPQISPFYIQNDDLWTLLRPHTHFLPLQMTCGDAAVYGLNAQTVVDASASLGNQDDLFPWWWHQNLFEAMITIITVAPRCCLPY